MPRKVTINMVAERAGVSRGTVDRVLNQRPHVRPELHHRVVQAIRELGYVPPKEDQSIALGLENCHITKKNTVLGVVMPNWKGYFRSEVMSGIRDARELLHNYFIDVLIEECDTTLPEESIERMENLVEQGAAGISICAMDHPLVARKIDELSEKGIPVITYNSDISDCSRLCFVGQDLSASGRVAGELMAKYLKTDDQLIAAVANPNFHAHRLRLQGFCDLLYEKGFQKSSIHLIETYNDYMLTFQNVKNVLRQVPEIKGIYMANHSVSGCAEAIQSMGMTGKIHVISHDLTESTKRLLKSGRVDFAIAQDIYQQGYRPLLELRKQLHRTSPREIEISRQKIDIICAENIYL